jgi:hypothetical protein
MTSLWRPLRPWIILAGSVVVIGGRVIGAW